MRLKPLIKKFSYNQLLDVCEKKGWRIPLISELQSQSLEYDTFWILDTPTKLEDINTHAYLYNSGSMNKMQLVNKLFIQHAIVIIDEQKCIWTGNEELNIYTTKCKNSFQIMECNLLDNTFMYCPYCGKKIKETK